MKPIGFEDATPRRPACRRTLEAAPAQAVLVDIYNLPNPRVGGRFDDQHDDPNDSRATYHGSNHS